MLRLLNPRSGSQFLKRITSSKLTSASSPFGYSYSSQAGHERNIVDAKYGPVDIPKMSLPDFLFRGIEKVADKPAITCGSSKRSYNYGMLYEMTKRMAGALLSQKGCALHEKEVIGILLPNMPEYVPAIHGCLLAGLTATFANPLYTPEEICRQFDMAGVRLIITLPVLLPVAQVYKSKAKKYKGTISIGGRHNVSENIFGFEELLREDHKVDLPVIDPEDTAILPFSSGTTGMPKGVELSHNNLVANLAQGSHPEMNRYYRPEYANIRDTILTIPPFFHIYGFNGILNESIKCRNHLISIPR